MSVRGLLRWPPGISFSMHDLSILCGMHSVSRWQESARNHVLGRCAMQTNWVSGAGRDKAICCTRSRSLFEDQVFPAFPVNVGSVRSRYVQIYYNRLKSTYLWRRVVDIRTPLRVLPLSYYVYNRQFHNTTKIFNLILYWFDNSLNMEPNLSTAILTPQASNNMVSIDLDRILNQVLT